MLASLFALIAGLILLLWSAERFVVGASVLARHFGMPPLLIGMLIVGFGTSAPEMVVSAVASWQGNPGVALGNAFGSNIANIGLILGLTALIAPIAVHSSVLRKELPVLAAITLLAVVLLLDHHLGRGDAAVLLAVFAGLVLWTIRQGLRHRDDILGSEIAGEMTALTMPLGRGAAWLVGGLVVLILSSRLVVWGAVSIAHAFGVSDLIIGLTVIAIGTSLPELASSLVAVRKKEHDIALGNVLGSNLFNTLAVVGIAGALHPLAVGSEVIGRDLTVMLLMTFSLFVIGYGFRGPGRINRYEGLLLFAAWLGYTSWLIKTVVVQHTG